MEWEIVAVIATGVLFLSIGLGLGWYARKRRSKTVDSSGSGGWKWIERTSFIAGIFGTVATLLGALSPLANPFDSPAPAKTPTSTDPVYAPGPNIGEPKSPPSAKRWINTFADAPGWRCADNACEHVGTLTANRNYVFCVRRNVQVNVGKDHNYWWLWTDLDAGGKGWISAYYIKGQGNDQANDIYGHKIPACA